MTEDVTPLHFDDKVVSIFVKPADLRRDQNWSDTDKENIAMLFAIIGNTFFLKASQRQCLILAALLRDMVREYPQDGLFFSRWAANVEERARESDRVPYRMNEMNVPHFG